MVKTPALFDELASVFGASAALAIYRRFGGQIVSGWHERHTRALAAELGPELAAKIARHFVADGSARSGLLEFHVGWIGDLYRDARIHAMADNGLPVVAIGAVTGISQRHARRILDGDAAGQRQAA